MLRTNKRQSLRKLFTLIPRRYASLASSNGIDTSILRKYPVGLKQYGFEIINTQLIEEFSIVAVLLKNEVNGSQHLHLDAHNDNNNVFSIAFKTNPPDNTGVPHILEHTTLCGSKKFPVRDPFFKMNNRSLSNFMNAMTGHDYTFFPFATTNAKDFENLMDVYLSSVFEPLLNYNDFLQEGWRIENSNLTDINSNLEFKGIVCNEMKGQYSNSMYYFYIKFLESIYPSLNNSGGDPLKMTDLSYEDLLQFHATNYHPSNAKTFTYGNLPLSENLKRLSEYYKQFGKRSPNNVVKKPIFVHDSNKTFFEVKIPGPLDSMIDKDISEQFNSSITWNLGDPLDPKMHYTLFKWKILGSLLFDGHNSPFYQNLIETGYSEDFSANSGIDSTTAMFSFTVGLNYLTEAKVAELETKILDIIKNDVIPKLKSEDKSYNDRVVALLHQIEIGFKKHKPEFGFGLLSSLVPSWINGSNPIDILKVETILRQFKEEYNEKGLKMFHEMLDNSVLNDKTQKFKFTMYPEKDFNTNLNKLETKNLEKKVKELTEEDKNIIYDRNLKLAESQKEEQDADVLPTLSIEDISKKGDFYSIEFSQLVNSKNQNQDAISKRIVDTNGLIYAYALKDISYLPTNLYKYLPLFNNCLTNLAGTSKTSITDLETKIQMLTGGVSFNNKITVDPYNIDKMKLHYSLSGLSLKQNSRHIYNLWYEILTETKFDINDGLVLDKLNTLIKNMGQNQINNIADRGHSYACGLSNSRLTPAKYVGELTGGLDQVQFIMEMNKKLDEQGKEYLSNEILPNLKKIQEYLLMNENQFKYRIVGDKEIVDQNVKLISKFDQLINEKAVGQGIVDNLNNLDSLLSNFNYNQPTEKTLVNLPFQVGYSCLAKKGSSFASKQGAHLQILSQLYTFKNLHSKIRESNGAYGGGLNYDGLGGTLNFYSYRDPNPIKSISTFESSFPYGLTADWSEKDLTEAKLRIFQSIDAPINIANQGSSKFFDGISDEMRQERRENFLSTNVQDLRNVTQEFLVENKNNSITVIGNNELLNVDNDWNVKNMKL
ncbi:CYM1 [Candida pseudojiufengensis]|uniref:CYM1 n=1 Tax=Candida pseudojiufengensis TaxID=497109 RepID=UPI0022252A09|nr:CYM1 [Candida pseudojiufengensis]KAI5965248.1 CYM1 [Candida pseudojiufengensis]